MGILTPLLARLPGFSVDGGIETSGIANVAGVGRGGVGGLVHGASYIAVGGEGAAFLDRFRREGVGGYHAWVFVFGVLVGFGVGRDLRLLG